MKTYLCYVLVPLFLYLSIWAGVVYWIVGPEAF